MRLFRTVRHLKPAQVLGRLYFSWYRPRPSVDVTPVLRHGGSSELYFPPHTQRMLGPKTFRFLNETRELSLPPGWHDPSQPRLWEYNLHYFEDLVAQGAADRGTWHRELVERWVVENPPFDATGWEPFPLSIRIGNWIKWALAGNELAPAWRDSLALQAEYLSRRIEWHLMGNHLFENARALVMAGLFFAGSAADRWREKGLRILDSQLDEQILDDGGHFERSPMYHGLVLEGLLDLVQLSEYYDMNGDRVPYWRRRSGEMLAWMRAMSHPDGEISFFNDAALDVALPPGHLAQYAKWLNIDVPEGREGEGVALLEQSGYVHAVRGEMVMFLDVAPVGPDHQPGHAHADTLSFELSVSGRRVLVNSGTSVYGLGGERLRQRGTAAHNTVVVDGENSSEVWSGFRVGRRARPFDVSIRGSGEIWQVQASHDGYRRLLGGATHRRRWSLSAGSLSIEDTITGQYDDAVAHFHFHPDVEVSFDGSRGMVVWEHEERVGFIVERGQGILEASTYHPAFGADLENKRLAVTLEDGDSRVVFEVKEVLG